jgi:SAM-dependent methyltransferase
MRISDRIILKLGRWAWENLRDRRGYILFRIDFIRNAIVRWRKEYFIERSNRLRIWDGERTNLEKIAPGRTAIEHNLDGLHDISGCRGLRIIRPLSVIETYRPLSQMPARGGWFDLDYVCDAKVLDIGPRTEGEMFMLIAHGFRPENIRGLDLISYSPMIDIGDMHSMSYEDNAFDITIASCVLVYSENPRLACSEFVRVTKDGGLICISQDTVPSAGSSATAKLGKPLLWAEDYLELFDGHVGRVFYRHELAERLKPLQPKEGSNYTMSLIFEVSKGKGTESAS